jgi:hypothetical protein
MERLSHDVLTEGRAPANDADVQSHQGRILMSPWMISTPAFRAKVAIAVVAAIGSAHLSRAAWADDTASKAAAKARLERGADLLVTHGYTAALVEFEDAYRLFPSPKIFFDIGLANVGLNRNPDAVRAFQRFLVEATDAAPETAARAKAQIEALLPRVAVVDIACPKAGMEILFDDRSVGRTPLSGPVYLDPGQHGLTARANESGAPFVTTFAVAAGARITVLVPAAGSLPAASEPSPTSASPTLVVDRGSSEHAAGERPLYRRPWLWAAAAGVVAVVAVTLVLTGGSTSNPSPSLGHMDLPGAP